jgi:hypothetical protein
MTIYMDKETLYWVKSMLTNDENASDEEMRACFIERGLNEAQADEWIAKRSFYRNNIVMEDDDRNDIGIFDPKTGMIQPLPPSSSHEGRPL